MPNYSERLRHIGYELLKIDRLRHEFCMLRYRLGHRRMRLLESMTEGVGEYTVGHNMAALNERAAFGMGNRMALLLYPIAAAMRGAKDARILVVGPRTEDDLFWAKSLGLVNVRGLDLFSYSAMIDVGDIHATDYPSQHFDAVILGWVISYSNQPEKLVAECKRIVKAGGYLGFGIEANAHFRSDPTLRQPRVNFLNSARDICDLVREPILFLHDPATEVSTDNAVVFQVAKDSCAEQAGGQESRTVLADAAT